MAYRSIDSVPWNITVNAVSYQPPGNPGFCDIDGKVVAPLSVTTTTINNDWRTDVTVNITWTCRQIYLNIAASWYVRACYAVFGPSGGAVFSCNWRKCLDASLGASYRLSPGSGTCNIDGNYVRTSTDPPAVNNLGEWHLEELIPPLYPVDCPDCVDFGGPMQCGYLPSQPFGWVLDSNAMLAGLPTAIQVTR